MCMMYLQEKKGERSNNLTKESYPYRLSWGG